MKPHRLSMILGGVLAVLVAAGVAGYVYALRYLKAETASYQAVLTTSAQLDAQLEALGQERSTFDKKIAPMEGLIDTALPTSKQQTEVLAQLNRLATNNGLSLGSVSLPSPTGLPSSTSQTSAASGVLALPISFQLTGTYGQLQSFLTALENLNRSTTVTSLTITRPGVGKSITYAITLNAYMKP